MIQIRYYLSLPATTKIEKANGILLNLHSFCFDKPFDSVSDIEYMDENGLKSELEAERFPAQYPGLTPSLRMGFSCGLGEKDKSKSFGIYLFQYQAYKKIKVPWFFDNACWIDSTSPESLFLTRHIAILSALEHAQQLGMEVRVKDEGGYWESKSREKLTEMKRLFSAHPDPRDFCLKPCPVPEVS
jgi:hypothetical protein